MRDSSEGENRFATDDKVLTNKKHSTSKDFFYMPWYFENFILCITFIIFLIANWILFVLIYEMFYVH
jgi:hypothetical protein